MWIFTTDGFFSAVAAREGKGEPGQPVDLKRVMVRARVKQHLVNLQKRFACFAQEQIMETPEADYRYRIILDREAWSQVLAELALDVYPNFKSKAHEQQEKLGNGYVRSLHQVWQHMYELQAVNN